MVADVEEAALALPAVDQPGVELQALRLGVEEARQHDVAAHREIADHLPERRRIDVGEAVHQDLDEVDVARVPQGAGQFEGLR
ncbi:hypothetical protein ACFQ60_13770 [Streptomyces zhihengii]